MAGWGVGVGARLSALVPVDLLPGIKGAGVVLILATPLHIANEVNLGAGCNDCQFEIDECLLPESCVDLEVSLSLARREKFCNDSHCERCCCGLSDRIKPNTDPE